MPEPAAATLSIEPVISWPREAAPGKRYLLTVDLRTSQTGDDWPFDDQEEVEFSCLLDAHPLFAAELLDDPVLVVHRFGGTYRPVRYLLDTLTVEDQSVPNAIRLTLSTRWGVPVRTVSLPVTVAERAPAEDGSISRTRLPLPRGKTPDVRPADAQPTQWPQPDPPAREPGTGREFLRMEVQDSARPNAKIVCIHGEGQQVKSAEILSIEWLASLRDGLRRASIGYPAAVELPFEGDIRFVFYGDLFRPSGRMLGPGEDWPDPADTTQFEREILQQQERTAADIDPNVIQPDPNPRGGGVRPLRAMLRSLSRSSFFSGLAERAILNNLKELHRYLTDPELRMASQQRLAAVVDESTQVIVAHSLGTLIAYEALCVHPEWPVRALVTLGSPLGLGPVFDRLQPAPRLESQGSKPIGHWPGAVETWTNIADVNDLIAAVKDLRPLFGPRVDCHLVDNGVKAYGVQPYLSSAITGNAILSGLNELSQSKVHAGRVKPDSSHINQAEARRFLLTCVITRYYNDPSWDREELTQDLERIVTLFTRDFGYEHVPIMGLDPTQQQIHDALREFCTSPDRRPDDYIVVYLAGHGEVLPIGDSGFEHVLLPADTVPIDLRRRVVKSGDLAEWILADTPVHRLLLIVDTCFSGQGGLDFAQNARAHIGTPTRLIQQERSAVVIVTATRPRQQAMPGAFTKAFVRAVQHQTAFTQIPQALSIDAVLNFLREDPDLPASQQAQWSVVVSSGELPDFLPNPRRDPASADSNSTEQDSRRRSDSMIEALVYTMRDLSQQTAGVMHEIEQTGQPAFITRHGRFVATITPLEPGRVESRILAEIARQIGKTKHTASWNDVNEALVYTMRDLSQQTASVMHEIEQTGQPAFITRHGRFVATITPLEPGRVESRILAEIAREIMAGQTGKPEGV